MPYLNFTKITPPAPNDPFVDEAAQLNANWDQLESKMAPYINGTVPTGMEAGQEFWNGGRFAVWDGAAARNPDDIDAAWSAWTTLPILAPRTARSATVPKWRNNSLLRKVELTGGVISDSLANPWTLGSAFALNADTSGAIPASMTPIGGTHYATAAVGLTTGTAVTAGAYLLVDKPGGNTFVRIRGQYMGGPGGGNYIQLEQLWWWY